MHGVSDALPPTWKASPGFSRGWLFFRPSPAGPHGLHGPMADVRVPDTRHPAGSGA